MRILAYNIYEGGIGRIDPIAEVIRQTAPDIVILPEATDRAEFEKLADRLAMDSFLASSPRNPEGAVGFLTRFDIREAVNYSPLDDRFTRAVGRLTVTTDTGPFTVFGVHFNARETLADEAVRLQEWAALEQLVNAWRTGPATTPYVLAGDFNAHHPDQIIDLSTIRKKTRERIAPQNNQIPREVVGRILAAGYADAHALTHAPKDFRTSLTTACPALRTDYIFVPAVLAPAVKSCDYPRIGGANGLTRFASDHFPVLADI